MRVLRFVLTRVVLALPQLFGVALVAFFLLKLIPGDPAPMMLGPLATQESVDRLRAEMGLDQPTPVQFASYLGRLVQGDLGRSWQTTNPVLTDLAQRLPATLELITLGLLLAILIGLPLGVLAGRRPAGRVSRLARGYVLGAGALPDFWLALVLIYVFFTLLGWAPAPMGRLDFASFPPARLTGSHVLDALLAGDLRTARVAASHLVLPVLTLGIVYAVPVIVMCRATVARLNETDFIRFARAKGLPRWRITLHALRNALPAVVNVIGVLYGTLIGSVVLVEVVFAWGGAGQYAVSAVLNADINAALGFILAAAVFSLIVHLLIDVVGLWIDPAGGSD